jgi:hypothetical protein
MIVAAALLAVADTIVEAPALFRCGEAPEVANAIHAINKA